MKNVFPTRAPLLLGACLLLFFGVLAKAQNGPKADASKADASALPTRKFTIDNVPVDLLVWWLDSSHQPLPLYIRSSLNNGGEVSRQGLFVSPNLSTVRVSPAGAPQAPGDDANPHLLAPPQGEHGSGKSADQSSAPRKLGRFGNALGPLGAALPAEVSIVAVEKERNRLTARGPLAGLDALSEIIRQIDVPLQQAEVRMTLVEVARDDLKTLGLTFPAKAGLPAEQQTRTAIALAPEGGRALDELIQNKAAKLLSTPQFVVLSGLTGKVRATEMNSTILDYKYQDAPANSAPGFFFVETSNALTCGLEVTGDMVALRIRIEWDDTVASVAGTLRDGQTLAIRLPNSDPNSKTVRLGFLTPHIIKRAA